MRRAVCSRTTTLVGESLGFARLTHQTRGITLASQIFSKQVAAEADPNPARRAKKWEEVESSRLGLDQPIDQVALEQEYKALVSQLHAKQVDLDPLRVVDAKIVLRQRILDLERVKIEKPENYQKRAEAWKAYIEALVDPKTWEPRITATIQQPFDTKDHKFITDYARSSLNKERSEKNKRDAIIDGLRAKYLGDTPKSRVDEFLDRYDSVFPEIVITEKPIVPVSELLEKWFPKTSSEELGLIPPYYKPGISTEQYRKDMAAHFAKLNNIAPGTPDYKNVEVFVSDEEPVLKDYIKEAVETNRQLQERASELQSRGKPLLESGAFAPAKEELDAYPDGEHRRFLRALDALLSRNATPSDDDKLKFMKKHRERIIAERQRLGLHIDVLLPHIKWTPPHLSDAELVRKFDEEAAQYLPLLKS